MFENSFSEHLLLKGIFVKCYVRQLTPFYENDNKFNLLWKYLPENPVWVSNLQANISNYDILLNINIALIFSPLIPAQSWFHQIWSLHSVYYRMVVLFSYNLAASRWERRQLSTLSIRITFCPIRYSPEIFVYCFLIINISELCWCLELALTITYN